jgi:integrase
VERRAARRVLGWAEGNSQNYPLWHTLAMTGMRRSEALALRWRDATSRRPR